MQNPLPPVIKIKGAKYTERMGFKIYTNYLKVIKKTNKAALITRQHQESYSA